MLSLAATVIFVLLVGSLLADNNALALTNPWSASQYGTPQTPSRSSPKCGAATTLEHALASPTPLHGFTSLPVLACDSIGEEDQSLDSREL